MDGWMAGIKELRQQEHETEEWKKIDYKDVGTIGVNRIVSKK